MAIIKCPECGHQVSDHAKTCPSCGVDIAGNIVRCPECGELTFAYQDVCPNCHCTLIKPIVVEPTSVRYDDGRGQTVRPQQFVGTSKPSAEPKKKRHPVAIAFVVALVASLTVVFLGIYLMNKMDQQNETDAYERAVVSGEPLILQDYLLRYPQAAPERRDSVGKILDRLQKIENDWQTAYGSKNREKLLAFVEKYPQNKHVKEARLTVDSLDWVLACEKNSVESFEAYLKAYSNQGEYSDEATMKLDEAKAARIAAEEKARQDSIAAAQEKLNAEQEQPTEVKKPAEAKKPAETKKPADSKKK